MSASPVGADRYYRPPNDERNGRCSGSEEDLKIGVSEAGVISDVQQDRSNVTNVSSICGVFHDR